MSETSVETTRSGGGNVFTRKLGPLPMWGWMAIVVLLAIMYKLYSSNKASQQASSSTSSVNSPGGVDASLVPQFVNQTYTNTTPPAAPSVTVNNQIPSQPSGPPTTGSSTPTPAASVHQYPQPQGLTATKASNTSLKASWSDLTSPQPVPTSYTVAVYQGSKEVANQTVNAPDTTGGKSTVTITGLPANAKNLQVHVWANGGQLAPPHASTNVSL